MTFFLTLEGYVKLSGTHHDCHGSSGSGSSGVRTLQHSYMYAPASEEEPIYLHPSRTQHAMKEESNDG
jgi:hypothetical protein